MSTSLNCQLISIALHKMKSFTFGLINVNTTRKSFWLAGKRRLTWNEKRKKRWVKISFISWLVCYYQNAIDEETLEAEFKMRIVDGVISINISNHHSKVNLHIFFVRLVFNLFKVRRPLIVISIINGSSSIVVWLKLAKFVFNSNN